MTVLATTNRLFLLSETQIHSTVNDCLLTWREHLHENHLKLTFYLRISHNRDSVKQESCTCLNNNNKKKAVSLSPVQVEFVGQHPPVVASGLWCI